MGTIGVLDPRSHTPTMAQRAALQALARQAVVPIELRTRIQDAAKRPGVDGLARRIARVEAYLAAPSGLGKAVKDET